MKYTEIDQNRIIILQKTCNRGALHQTHGHQTDRQTEIHTFFIWYPRVGREHNSPSGKNALVKFLFFWQKTSKYPQKKGLFYLWLRSLIFEPLAFFFPYVNKPPLIKTTGSRLVWEFEIIKPTHPKIFRRAKRAGIFFGPFWPFYKGKTVKNGHFGGPKSWNNKTHHPQDCSEKLK